MFWFLYNVLFHVVYLLMLPKFLLRMRRRGGYREDFGERFFRVSEEKKQKLSEGRKIWIHAVSVGEFGVARSFMEEWRLRYPEAEFVVTVNTSTAHELAKTSLKERDVLLYPPLDSPWIVMSALRTIKPIALVLVETEMWPNLLRACRRLQIPTLLLNGRISDRSFKRLEKVLFYTRRLYDLVDTYCMQSVADAGRAIQLGAPKPRVRVMHSIKYDGLRREVPEETSRKERLIQAGFMGPEDIVLLGSSTWPGEEKALTEAFLEIRKDVDLLRLILVPRHFERKQDVLEDLTSLGVKVAFWSDASDQDLGDAEVLVVDTTGELKHFTGFADRVFVGKSLYLKEGQNPLEAAFAGKWIVTGPGMANFRGIMEDLHETEAVMQIEGEEELEMALRCSFEEEDVAELQGNRASKLVESRKGGLARSADELLVLLTLQESSL